MNAIELYTQVFNGKKLKYKAALSNKRWYIISKSETSSNRFIISCNELKTKNAYVDEAIKNIIENIITDNIQYELI
jgi:hypothetical protein